MSAYIGTIPLSGDISIAAGHHMCCAPLSWIAVTAAISAQVGEAANESHSAAR